MREPSAKHTRPVSLTSLSFATHGLVKMKEMWRDTSAGFILAGQYVFSYYAEALISAEHKIGDTSFLPFMSGVVIYDPRIEATSMIFVDALHGEVGLLYDIDCG